VPVPSSSVYVAICPLPLYVALVELACVAGSVTVGFVVDVRLP
jgi:hypothetical protein